MSSCGRIGATRAWCDGFDVWPPTAESGETDAAGSPTQPKCAIAPDELEALGAEYRDASKALAAVVREAPGEIPAERPDLERIKATVTPFGGPWNSSLMQMMERDVLSLIAYIAQQDQALADAQKRVDLAIGWGINRSADLSLELSESRAALAESESASGGRLAYADQAKREFERLTGELATRTQQLEALTQLNERNCADAQRVMSASEGAVGLALAMNDRLEVMKADRDAALAECARLRGDIERLMAELNAWRLRCESAEKKISAEAYMKSAEGGGKTDGAS